MRTPPFHLLAVLVLTVLVSALIAPAITRGQAPDSVELSGVLAEPRADHTATTLADGRILVTGGEAFDGVSQLTEIYDPTTAEFSEAALLQQNRKDHTATRLNNGTILIVGGEGFGDPLIVLDALSLTEVYLPDEDRYALTNSLNAGRTNHTATLLNDGRVLVTGGTGVRDVPLASAEIYDPATFDFFDVAPMLFARADHSAVLLPDGRVLVAGGTRFVEIYDPTTDSWESLGALEATRLRASATLMNDGRVLVAGGQPILDSDASLNTAEIINPATGTIETPFLMPIARTEHTATLLPNGNVLIAGGFDFSVVLGRVNTNRADLFDPTTGAFTPAADALVGGTSRHTATLLRNGTVFIVGGDGPRATTQIYTPLPPPPPAPVTRTVSLVPGWNLVGWTADAAVTTSINDTTATIAASIDVLFTWDTTLNRFLSFNPTGPTFLNTLNDLAAGDGVWIRNGSATVVAWTQPALNSPRTVTLSAGFNLVLWTGPDATPTADAVAALGDSLQVLFTWDAAAQRFLSFDPTAPTFLNSATVLNNGDGVWISVGQNVNWDQPAVAP